MVGSSLSFVVYVINMYVVACCGLDSQCLLFWAFSSDGRAPASHVGGRGIDTSNVQSLVDEFLFHPALWFM